ncbi:MAG TPA: MFS transporter [Clostridiales bacterium]|nr:MFS transporter [Clostridiales bacterium]
MEEKLKLDYKKTILIGFGFMATSIVWQIYDPYITKILNEMLSNSELIARWSATLAERYPILLEFLKAQGEKVDTAGGFTLVPLFIGIIMTFDNIFGVIFQPALGKLSDRTHTRLGKRRPYILVGAPISALLFALIPWMFVKFNSLPGLMICIILFVFVMSTWRAPVVALMPDLTPPELRSEGNAVINLCGGVGGFIGMISGTILSIIFGLIYGKDNFTEQQTYPYVFLLGSVVMIICTLVLFFFVKEPDSRIKAKADANMALEEEKKLKEEKKKKLKEMKLSKAERKSLIFMLFGLFFLFCSANAITTFFALFAAEILGKTTAQATLMMAVFLVCSMLMAIPAGKLGHKYGRKKTILAGLFIFIGIFLVYLVSYLITGKNWAIWLALVFGGAANMMITVNTLPLVLEIGGVERIGTFTGYYYTATFSAQIAAPIIYGAVRMFTGTYLSLFVYCPIAFLLAILCISMVKHGEAIPAEELKKIQAEVDAD